MIVSLANIPLFSLEIKLFLIFQCDIITLLEIILFTDISLLKKPPLPRIHGI